MDESKRLNFWEQKSFLVSQEDALPGRSHSPFKQGLHKVKQVPIIPPFPEGKQSALFGLGCFWGAEKLFWVMPGIYTTAVGYSAGLTPHPLYEEVCSGMTGHTEAVQVVFDPDIISYQHLVTTFFEEHNPTQGMRQGNDIGTQYRSGIYTFSDNQQQIAEHLLAQYQVALLQAGYSKITTEVLPVAEFYFAEPYHQQYLADNPHGYCGLAGAGVGMPKAGFE